MYSYNLYYLDPHVLSLFQFSIKVQVFVNLFFFKLWYAEKKKKGIIDNNSKKKKKNNDNNRDWKKCRNETWVETIQTTALLRATRMLRRVLGTWGDLLSLKLLWKTLADASIKNSEKSKIILIIIWPEYWEESWRLAVTQNPVRNYQLMLVWKTLQSVKW